MSTGDQRPIPPSDAVRRRMEQQRREDTGPELALRRELHRRGRRYRIHARIDGLPRRRVDIVFPRQRVAVFVDGCFWHGCPEHGVAPKNNREWWAAKLAANIARDRDTDARLSSLGWTTVRVWEHVAPQTGADRIEAILVNRGLYGNGR